MGNPIVSVVLPFYNASGTLERAIKSIYQQEFDAFECILMDNNSTDGGSEIALDWEAKDKRFKVINESRQGVMFASNAGCEHAVGRYIARMDADDWSHPRRLTLEAGFLRDHPEFGAVAGLVRHVGDPVSTEGFRRFVDWSNSLCSYEDIFNRRFIEAPLVNPSVMWRRETMLTHGLYRRGAFPEDYEMWLRWLDQGVKIAKIPEVILDWYDSGDRLTRTDPIYSEHSFYEVKSRYLAKWLANHNPFHPFVSVWGASRISRKRAGLLVKHGITIKGYIDTKRTRQLEQQVTYYEDLPKAGSSFVLTYIKQMDNREKIQDFLENKGYVEGVNYLLVS